MPLNAVVQLPELGKDPVLSHLEIPKPGKDEVLIKVQYAGVNPIDPFQQKAGFLVRAWPHILGADVAGTVAELGEGAEASGLKVGDRVCSWLFAQGGYAQYAVAPINTTAKVPDSVSLEKAVNVPLTLSTAAAGVFVGAGLSTKAVLSEDVALPQTLKEPVAAVVVWGASSAVGFYAVQLARLSVPANTPVVAAASPRVFDLLKSVGATHTVDYRSPSAAQEIRSILSSDADLSKGAAVVIDAFGSHLATPAVLECVDPGASSFRSRLTIVGNENGFPDAEELAKKGIDMSPFGAAILLGQDPAHIPRFEFSYPHQQFGAKVWAKIPSLLEEGKIVPSVPEVVQVEETSRWLEVIKTTWPRIGKVPGKKLVLAVPQPAT